ncbi:hypothetical protein L1049_020555 [Liquidambar formosana]|uniref:CCHC-type domain-containing protein n=1 Tax=Liquidambar formosana TaxID=63359 RepID=A0AAP0S832_LIQFO
MHMRSHEVAIAELTTLPSSRTVYQKNGNIFFRTTVSKAIASEQKMSECDIELACGQLSVAFLNALLHSIRAAITSIVAWICLPELPIEYFDDAILKQLGNSIGRTVHIDIHTLRASRGKFACMSVEVDLSRPLIPKVWLGNSWQRIAYEGFHLICFTCGKFGHRSENCLCKLDKENLVGQASTSSVASRLVKGPAKYGPWIIEVNSVAIMGDSASGSRFANLIDMMEEGEILMGNTNENTSFTIFVSWPALASTALCLNQDHIGKNSPLASKTPKARNINMAPVSRTPPSSASSSRANNKSSTPIATVHFPTISGGPQSSSMSPNLTPNPLYVMPSHNLGLPGFSLKNGQDRSSHSGISGNITSSAGNKAFSKNAKELIKVHSPKIFVIMETGLGSERAIKMVKRLGFFNSTHVDTKGFLAARISERLDKAFANVDGRLVFPEALVKQLPHAHFDHCPIPINLHGVSSPNPKLRPFRFLAAWLTHGYFKDMIKQSWDQIETNSGSVFSKFTTAAKI